jgi:C4-dicarboxylate transporter DctQ subunit
MLHKIVGALNYVEDALLAYFFVGLGILIVADIPGRKFNITEFYWLEELGRYIMICMTFLGASKAAKTGGHLSMNAVVRRLPGRARHVIQALTHLGCCGFLIYLDYYAWSHLIHVYKIGMRASTLGVPFYIPYLPIAVFLVPMFIRFFLCSLKEMKLIFSLEISREPAMRQ